jgi:hypothetical protein
VIITKKELKVFVTLTIISRFEYCDKFIFTPTAQGYDLWLKKHLLLDRINKKFIYKLEV